ncbi:sulfur oxidation c-type cytochrome SoxX [Methylobacterium sp. ARG-1]|uniref:sulfur oxidation c-type cytochrome SoxX n=1 Tax=Methylobacterium sp. ARG-1 TaxID=1692501 RepID=UPI0006802B5D|nr:sulfur oxidation c-type cytochrome SoxX [Methylobacterium sp. ARG-1]KNY24511.1 cytochrome C [Methylobacterium sp. ARG-1]
MSQGRSALILVLALAAPPSQAEEGLVPTTVVGDAIAQGLTGAPGDAARGRAIVVDRTRGLCLLCHAGPFPEERFQGNLAPDLTGVGGRLSPGQLRLRLVDGRVLNPETIMPSYYSLAGLARVGRAWQGRPILSAAEIEDVVAFLATLREAGPEESR